MSRIQDELNEKDCLKIIIDEFVKFQYKKKLKSGAFEGRYEFDTLRSIVMRGIVIMGSMTFLQRVFRSFNPGCRVQCNPESGAVLE